MRISLVAPFLVILVKKFKIKSIYLAFIFSGISFILSKIAASSNLNYFITIHYMPFFIVGSIIALHHEKFEFHYKNMTKNKKIILLIMSILCLSYKFWFFPKENILHIKIINDWVVSVGAMLIILISLYSNRLRKSLELRLFKKMGEISFSFYLLHFVILFSFINLFHEKFNYLIIMVVSFIVTYLGAILMNKYLEKPTISLAKKIEKQMTF